MSSGWEDAATDRSSRSSSCPSTSGPRFVDDRRAPSLPVDNDQANTRLSVDRDVPVGDPELQAGVADEGAHATAEKAVRRDRPVEAAKSTSDVQALATGQDENFGGAVHRADLERLKDFDLVHCRIGLDHVDRHGRPCER